MNRKTKKTLLLLGFVQILFKDASCQGAQDIAMPEAELTVSPKGSCAPLSIAASWIASIKCKTWAGAAADLAAQAYNEETTGLFSHVPVSSAHGF